MLSGMNARDIVGVARFRNSDDKQGVIDRAERALDEAFLSGEMASKELAGLRNLELIREREALQVRIHRLEDSIRQIKQHQASEIIFAIANMPETDSINTKAEAIGG